MWTKRLSAAQHADLVLPDDDVEKANFMDLSLEHTESVRTM
jgi:hypothetical protein